MQFKNVTYVKEDSDVTNIEKVNQFLDEAKTFCFLTTDGDQPKAVSYTHLLERKKLS